MCDMIVCCSQNYGIGYEGKMAWHCPSELALFRQKTLESVLIVGRITNENLPPLKNRIVIEVSRDGKSIEKVIDENKGSRIFIAGGGQVYQYALENRLVNRIHLSLLNKNYVCDTFLDRKLLQDWMIIEETKYEDFTHQILVYFHEFQYLRLLKEIKESGKSKIGRNGETFSKFFKNFSFNLQEGFPLLTTKKMFTRGILEELIFFIRGETNSKLLEEKGVNIWKGNTSRDFLDQNGMVDRQEGFMGPMYGYQWRFFNAEYDELSGKPIGNEHVDQLKYVLDMIKNDPSSRRILMTTFNPSQASNGVLYPCHSIVNQFYVENEYLDMSCYNRSQDLFLGVPFNIASSSFLLSIIAKISNLKPRFLHMTMGDVHIYKEHMGVIDEQLNRKPYPFPTLSIRDDITIDSLAVEDFTISNYRCYDAIKANMVA